MPNEVTGCQYAPWNANVAIPDYNGQLEQVEDGLTLNTFTSMYKNSVYNESTP